MVIGYGQTTAREARSSLLPLLTHNHFTHGTPAMCNQWRTRG